MLLPSSHQPGVGYLSGHGYVHNGQLSMSGVGLGHAVARWTAFGNDDCDLHPLTAFDGAEGELLPVVMGLHLQEEKAATHTGKLQTSYASFKTLPPQRK